ncbi:hypothetical protein CGMCC3_g11271 [Colletotrichum fructicola]|nr:uncharacterized protein CGMCC3_g11271 [Colletotrichum fructicola]KAE9572644.1 hypothetical protein CGMCC3_g11271 [Colletotrichum fructicola]
MPGTLACPWSCLPPCNALGPYLTFLRRSDKAPRVPAQS